MPRTYPAHLPTPGPTRDLDALARQLDELAEEMGWDAPPLLLGLTDDGVDEAPTPGPRLSLRAGEPDDLVAALVGFDAPPDWRALAVVVQGRAWTLDEPGADPRPVRLVHVVDREGGVSSLVRTAGDEPHDPGPHGQGRLVDVCRRALGLPTAPAPFDSVGLWALLWLDDLLARAARGEEIDDLAAAARSHPGVQAVLDGDPDLFDEAVAQLVEVGELQGRARPWPALRQAVGTGDWAVEDMEPAAASWMDDGMFARWVTAGFPSIEDYLRELRELLSEALVAEVQGVLEAWGLTEH